MKLTSGLDIVSNAKARYKRNNAIVDEEAREAFTEKMVERGEPEMESMKMAKDCSKLVEEDSKMMRVANNRLKGIYANKSSGRKKKKKKKAEAADGSADDDKDKREKMENKNFMNNKVMAMMDMTSDHWQPLESSSPFVKMFYKFTNMDSDDWANDRKRSFFDPTAKTTIMGKAVTEIDSSPETVIAFLFGSCGEKRMQRARER